jgi:hypothetical protein
MTRPFRSERCPCGFLWEHCPRRAELEFVGAARAADPGRGLAGRCHSPKRARPVLGPLCAFMTALAPAPATAAHCAFGEIWRVRLDECVSARSALAQAYVRPVSRLPRFRPPAVRRVADNQSRNDSEIPPPPPAAPAPTVDEATLVNPFVLPDLRDGAPAIWLLCQAAPNLCKPTAP